MSEAERARGLLTVSAGNTAQALAWCGRHFGVPAASLMPESAPQPKIDAVRAWGAEPRLVPTDELFRFLREHLWEQEDVAFVHPWTDRRVHLGHGSLGLEIAEWSYKDAPRERHIGPMAQDFHAAFKLGRKDTHIATLDSSGVALAGIQALVEENTELKQRLAALEAQVAQLVALQKGTVDPSGVAMN